MRLSRVRLVSDSELKLVSVSGWRLVIGIQAGVRRRVELVSVSGRRLVIGIQAGVHRRVELVSVSGRRLSGVRLVSAGELKLVSVRVWRLAIAPMK